LPAAAGISAKYWWIRGGTLDTNTAHTIVGNLAASLENPGDNVNASMYWDGGHGDNDDAPEFITWIGNITGHAEQRCCAALWAR
jgi:hypothetical protein